jgi:hypothetical protein
MSKMFGVRVIHWCALSTGKYGKCFSCVLHEDVCRCGGTDLLILNVGTTGVPRIFFGWVGGVQQIQVSEGRENRDLGAVAP